MREIQSNAQYRHAQEILKMRVDYSIGVKLGAAESVILPLASPAKFMPGGF